MNGFHDPRQVLRAAGLWTKKQFGQNFLIDASLPDRIAAAGGAVHDDVVFEIGAGLGTLTRALAPRVGRLIALEHDRDLMPVLRAELAEHPHVEVRAGNVLDTDWVAEAEAAGRPLVVYGNLPYHLSTDILLGLLAAPTAWTRACFLLQYEFAVRLAAPPGERETSALSAHAALTALSTLMFPVPASSFHPAPKVESAVLVMERLAAPPVDVGDPIAWRQVVRALFAQRRKMARKALKALTPEAEALLAEAGLDGTRRGETFTLAELAALSRAFSARSPAAQPARSARRDRGSAP
ncbi:MAG: ribosomal RNA small subunit methyltransferase A [Myxococcales bacterium]|nr:ribosomal RNA small subunit methyltransferase A [Myxococcales bacterium]